MNLLYSGEVSVTSSQTVTILSALLGNQAYLLKRVSIIPVLLTTTSTTGYCIVQLSTTTLLGIHYIKFINDSAAGNYTPPNIVGPVWLDWGEGIPVPVNDAVNLVFTFSNANFMAVDLSLYGDFYTA